MILGLDTGVATLGWALYDEQRRLITDLGVSLAHRDTDVPMRLDQAQRSVAQAKVIANKAPGCSSIVIEAMAFPPSSSHAITTGLSWGVVVGIACMIRPMPKLLTIHPRKWQYEIFGRRADYEEVSSAATAHIRARHPAAFVALERIPDKQRSHAIDAAMMAMCAGMRERRCDELDAVETITFGQSCPHGERRGSAFCSQCRRATVRHVEFDDRIKMLIVDGDVQHARPVDPGIDEKYRERARRGNRRSSKNRRVTV
jgi:hypothetical protein